MSLTSCLAALGADNFADEDLTALQARFSAHIDAGLDETAATQQAIRDVIDALGAEVRVYRQFAGPQAKTADTFALARAVAAEKQGVDAEAIRQSTGWHKGVDGKWRFEIDDSQAKLIRPISELTESKLFRAATTYKLSDVLDHPQLYAAYPDAANINFIVRAGFFDLGGLQGAFDGDNQIQVTPYAKDPESTILHEVQHWIQSKELFAAGGNQSSAVDFVMQTAEAEEIAKEALDKAEKQLDKAAAVLTLVRDALANHADLVSKVVQLSRAFHESARAYPDPKAPLRKAAFNSLKEAQSELKAAVGLRSLAFDSPEWRAYQLLSDDGKKHDPTTAATQELLDVQTQVAAIKSGDREALKKIIVQSGQAYNLYTRLGGEIEARNTQARQKLSAEQRQQQSPESTQDVESSRAIVVFNGTEMSSTLPPANGSPIAPTFYSAALAGALSLPQEKGTPEQMVNLLLKQKDVKPAEIEWLGLREYLSGLGKTVTKQQMIDFLAAKGVQVVPVELRSASKEANAAALEVITPVVERNDNLGYDYASEAARDILLGMLPLDSIDVSDADRAEIAAALKQPGVGVSNVKYPSYVLPGGTHYREVLLTLPVAEVNPAKLSIRQLRVDHPKLAEMFEEDIFNYADRRIAEDDLNIELNNVFFPGGDRKVSRETSSELRSLYPDLVADNARLNDKIASTYGSSHYPDQPNILAHIRLNDRTDANGRKVLFVEEVQSDWHQDGRKKGYKVSPGKDLPTGTRVLEPGNEYADVWAVELPFSVAGRNLFYGASRDEAIGNALSFIAQPSIQAVPDAPFKNNAWVELAVKQVLRLAAEGGYDAVAWTTGEQQADRYDLSKELREINYLPYNDGTYEVSAVLLDGREYSRFSGRKNIEEVERTFGKEIAEKMQAGVATRIESGVSVLAGDNLKVGGKGMLAFYNNIVPNAVKSVARKLDKAATVEMVTFRDTSPNAAKDDKLLADLGVSTEGGQPVGQPAIAITDKMRESAMRGQPLFQQGDAVQGDTLVSDTELLVRLSSVSDESTMLHELAHVFLEMEKRMAAKYGMTEEATRVLEVLGVTSFDEIGTKEHELFARTYEAYLLDGKAPSMRLREAFAAFSRWLARIYQGMKLKWLQDQSLPLTKEVTDMFDRLLATQAEIEEMKVSDEYQQLFRSKEQAGMTDEQWKKYQETLQRRNDRAQVTLEDKLLKVIRDARTAEWKTEKAAIADEERQRLLETPVYRALKELTTVKLDSDLVKRALGVDKIPPGRLLSVSKRGGEVGPDDVYAAAGFESPRQMLDAIQNAPSLEEAANAAAEQRMLAKYGDVLNDGTIEQEAQEAFHNDVQAEVLLQEIRALKRRSANRKTPDIDRAIIAAKAKDAVSQMSVKDLQPARFHRAEVRAAKAAAKAATPEEARLAKIQQLTNHYLFREALAAKAELAKIRSYIAKRQNMQHDVRDVHPDYSNAIQQIARLYTTAAPKDRAARAQAMTVWFEGQLRDRTDFAVTEPKLAEVLALRAAQVRAGEQPTHVYDPPPFDQLTLEQARGVYDQLRHLRWLGGREADIKQAEWAGERQELQQQLEADPRPPVGREAHTPSGERMREDVRNFGNNLLTIRNIIRELDNWDEQGAWARAVYDRLLDAQSTKRRLERETNEMFQAELSALSDLTVRKSESTLITKVRQDGSEWSLDEEERVMLAFYWGESYNRKAVMEGYKVTEADVVDMISTLTPEQAALVNSMWKVNEMMRPQLATASHDVYGYVPPMTIALPYQVGDLKFTGGHASLIYKNAPPAVDYLDGETPSFFSRGLAPGKASALYERTSSGRRQVLLSKDNFFRTLNDNVHFIAYGKVGLDLQQLVGNRRVQDAVANKHGMAFLRALNESIQGLTTNRKERDIHAAVAAVSRVLRRAATLGALGYSIRNTIQQFTSIPIITQELGPERFAVAFWNLYATGDVGRKLEMIHSRSEMMRSRSMLVNRESAEILREVGMPLGKAGRAWYWYQTHAFTPQAWVDMSLAYPAWLAKYEMEMEAHSDPDRARRAADTLVGETVGSGDDIFLSNFYRSNRSEATKTFTLMGSWANMYLNRVYKSARGGQKPIAPEALVTAFVTPVFVAVMSATFIMDWPDEDESFAAWVASTYGQFALSWLPALRDIYAYMKYRRLPGTGYAPAVEVLGEVGNGLEELIDTEKELTITPKGVVQTVTTVVPVAGSGLVVRGLDYVDSYNKGDEGTTINPWQAVVEGRDKNQ